MSDKKHGGGKVDSLHLYKVQSGLKTVLLGNIHRVQGAVSLCSHMHTPLHMYKSSFSYHNMLEFNPDSTCVKQTSDFFSP